MEPIVKVDQEAARSRVDVQFAALFAALRQQPRQREV
jgi:hypothetical protein